MGVTETVFEFYKFKAEFTIMAESQTDAENLAVDVFEDAFIKGMGENQIKIQATQDPDAKVNRLADYDIKMEEKK